MRDCLDDGMLQSYFDGELSRDEMADVSVHLASCIGCTRAVREIESENQLLSEAFAPEFAAAVPTERLRRRVEAAIVGLQVVHGSASGSNVRGWLQAIAELFTVSPQRAFGYAGLAAALVLAAIVGIVQVRRGPVTDVKTEVASVKTPAIDDKGAASASTPIVAAPSGTVLDALASDENRSIRHAAFHPKAVVSNSKAQAPQIKLLPGERSYLQQIASLDSTISANGNQPMRPGLQAEYERNLAFVNRAIAATRSAAKSNPNDPDAAEFMFAAYQSKVDLLNQVADARLSNRPQ